MSKEDDITNINYLENNLVRLKTSLDKVKSKYVSRKDLRDSAQALAMKWFEEVEPAIQSYNVLEEVKTRYHTLFTTLLTLSTKVSWKNTYIQTITEILSKIKAELLLPVLKSTGKIVSIPHLAKILGNATAEEKEYLEEALGCAERNFFRASVVLGWDAAVHRMQKVVEKLGFDNFNAKSEEMKKINNGRFKRFKKSFKVHSLSELRATVFDNDLLWVMEYWGLIDSNQHERLSICFTMRSNAAHPGEAPITPDNLASFYSDLKSFVFDNPKFKL
jgi:hypothetical protein